jgi:hypothetical protein
MKTRIHKIALGIALFGAVASLTAQPLITFDDLPTGIAGGLPIPNWYNGLNWNNFYVNNDVYELPYGPDGYLAGLVSLHNYAFNANGNPASISSANNFDLGSGYFTAAWNDNLNLEVKGYNGAALIYDNTYTLSAVSPSLITLNYADVTSVMFTSFGGTHHVGYSWGSGTHFVLDNLQLGMVPEPSCLTLSVLGA